MGVGELAGRSRQEALKRLERAGWATGPALRLEVSLADWQAANAQPAPWRFAAILLDPPRAELREAISQRFAAMVTAGAVTCGRRRSR